MAEKVNSNRGKNKLLIICGPTGTGKTKLALSLAKQFHGELVSADSRQVYKGFDALTGKDRCAEIPIWLYDVIEKGESFSVADFRARALPVIYDIRKRGKLPIVVGGTGFYLKALTEPMHTITIPPNNLLRFTLASLSREDLQKKLSIIDFDKFKKMNQSDIHNPRRLIRAIEVATWKQNNTTNTQLKQFNSDVYWIGLMDSMVTLKNIIQKRIKHRWNNAMNEFDNKEIDVLGYRHLSQFMHGRISKKDAINGWTRAEYQYAKRQMTWFRKQKDVHWFTVSEPQVNKNISIAIKSWYTL